MTENEAIERIKSGICNEIGTAKYCHDNCMHGVEHCAYSMAINALEEIQAYRAIGTVKGYERAIESSVENYNLYREYKAKVQAFEAIGTIDEFKALKEKNEPKKVTEFYETVHLDFICPSCNEAVYGQPYKPNYCKHCGQKLDWE